MLLLTLLTLSLLQPPRQPAPFKTMLTPAEMAGKQAVVNTTAGEFGSGRGVDAVAALEDSDKKDYLTDSIWLSFRSCSTFSLLVQKFSVKSSLVAESE